MTPRYFVIVSADRSGSTWLQGMLNAFPSVFCDFEALYSEEHPSPMHIPLLKENRPLPEILNGIVANMDTEFSHIGTKITVSPGHAANLVSRDGFSDIIGKDTAIIHVTRPYIDCAFSARFHRGHLRNPEGAESPRGSGWWIRSEVKEARVFPAFGAPVDIDQLRLELRRRHDVETFFSNLKDRTENYLLVDYSDIGKRLHNVADFLKLSVAHDAISNIQDKPPTKKLPPVDVTEAVENCNAFLKVGRDFEVKRLRLHM